MPIFRCDFKVTGDLVLHSEAPNLEMKIQEEFKIIFKNGDVNEEGHTTDLIVTIIGPASSIDNAQKELRSVLAEKLDLLTFATHSRFMIVLPIKLIEWDEGKRERTFKTFHTIDARHPPEPELIGDYLKTIIELEKSEPKKFVRVALKYFRYGLLDKQPDDQFMRLWLALEIIAENLKEKERVPIECPSCKTAMECKACGDEPTRIPMAKQAIEQIILNIVGKDGETVAKRQFDARNGLMHGGSSESIEKKCNMSMSDLVNELGKLVWHAIMSTFTFQTESSLCFGHRNYDFANKFLVVSMNGSFEHTEESPHPAEDKIPDVKISINTKFGSTED